MSTAVRFTVSEFDRMIEQGVFNDRPEQRLELIQSVSPLAAPSVKLHLAELFGK